MRARAVSLCGHDQAGKGTAQPGKERGKVENLRGNL